MADPVDTGVLRRLARRAPWIVKQRTDEPLILAAADEIDDLRAQEARLRSLIDRGPHAQSCDIRWVLDESRLDLVGCTCWKREAPYV